MKVAIGTDDRKTVRKSHFGGSRYFVVIEILNAEVVGREVRDNPHVEGQKTKKRHGEADAIIHLLEDCTLFMGRTFGKGSVDELSSRGVDCISTNIEEIDDAVCSYLDGRLEKLNCYSPDAKEHLPCAQRPYA